MNVNPTLMAIGTTLGIPTYPDEMRPDDNAGSFPDTFITFLYSDERPIQRGDGTDVAEAATIQVHLFTKGDPTNTKELLKTQLRKHFVIQSTAQYYEDDTGYSHLIITVWGWDTVTNIEPEEPEEQEDNNG